MNIAIFSFHEFEKPFFEEENINYSFNLHYFSVSLSAHTASLAQNFETIACFATDQLNAEVLKIISQGKTRFIALRSAGFNHVDLNAAKKYGFKIARVPAYSPYAVAEFTTALILSLNRKTHLAYNRVREGNFSLDGLLGFDLHQKTVGIIGTGKIGTAFAKIMSGFGCKILAMDPFPNETCKNIGVSYVTLNTLLENADIISLHCPLTAETQYLINSAAIVKMKKGVMLINTGRGGLIDTKAVIEGLKTKKIGHLGIDVYEEEENLFFHDLSNEIIQDDIFARLMTFPNVIVTGHQAFLTNEALSNIAKTTLANVQGFVKGNLKETLIV